MNKVFCKKKNCELLIEDCHECFSKERSGFGEHHFCINFNIVTKNIKEDVHEHNRCNM